MSGAMMMMTRRRSRIVNHLTTNNSSDNNDNDKIASIISTSTTFDPRVDSDQILKEKLTAQLSHHIYELASRLCPIQCQVCQRVSRENLDMISQLLHAGADPNQSIKIGKYTYAVDVPFLHVMCAGSISYDACKLMLEAGANVNARDSMGFPTLLKSTWNNSSSSDYDHVVNLLLQYGANPNERINDNGSTPLHRVAYCWAPSSMSALLDAGASVYIKNQDGQTAFHICILSLDRNANGPYYSRYTQEEKSKIVCEKIDILVRNGANINALTNKGLTPLHFACFYKNITVIRYLLFLDADPNIEDDNGKTPLSFVPNATEQNPEYKMVQQVFLDFESNNNNQRRRKRGKPSRCLNMNLK